MYSFVARFFFSTNHKCEALIMVILGMCAFSRNTITVKPLDNYLRYSKNLKQSIQVIFIINIEKQTFLIISPICKADHREFQRKKHWYQPSNLFFEIKKLFMVSIFFSFIRCNKVISRFLKGVIYKYGLHKYGYKGRFFYLKICSGIYWKVWSFSNLKKKSVQFLYLKNYYSSWESYSFKKLNVYKGKFVNLIEILADIHVLWYAYKSIKFNFPTTVQNLNLKTFDRINDLLFIRISKMILKGFFQFCSARNIKILRSNDWDVQMLTVKSFKNSVLYQSIQIILRHTYGSKFLGTLWEFWFIKNDHSALKKIRMNWTGVSWFLNFNIKWCFNSISKYLFVNILKTEIEDSKFINLVLKFLYIKSVKCDKNLRNYKLPPTFLDIYLHKLDLKIIKISKEYQKGKKRSLNINFLKKNYTIKKQNFKMFSLKEWVGIVLKHKIRQKVLKVNKMNWNDFKFARVKYVRYLLNFILGVLGSRSLMKKIQNKICIFAESILKLSLIKSNIAHIKSGKINFLGMILRNAPYSKFSKDSGKRLDINVKKRYQNRIKLQKLIKEKKILTILKSAVKKVLKGNVKSITKKALAPKIYGKIKALKVWFLQNNEFSKKVSKIYRQFMVTISKTFIFIPDKLKKDLIFLNQSIQEWEKNLDAPDENPKKKYIQLVGWSNLTLSIQIVAPLINIRNKFMQKNILSKSKKPQVVGSLIPAPDIIIIKWYSKIGRDLLNHYSCCQNFNKVKNYVNFILRWSAIYTLAHKHKYSVRKAIIKYTKDLIIKNNKGFILARFINSLEIKMMWKMFKS